MRLPPRTRLNTHSPASSVACLYSAMWAGGHVVTVTKNGGKGLTSTVRRGCRVSAPEIGVSAASGVGGEPTKTIAKPGKPTDRIFMKGSDAGALPAAASWTAWMHSVFTNGAFFPGCVAYEIVSGVLAASVTLSPVPLEKLNRGTGRRQDLLADRPQRPFSGLVVFGLRAQPRFMLEDHLEGMQRSIALPPQRSSDFRDHSDYELIFVCASSFALTMSTIPLARPVVGLWIHREGGGVNAHAHK